LSATERSAIASAAGNARTRSLTPAERKRIATLAVKAREAKRAAKAKQKEKGK
jgi:hypothetical protein